MQSGLNNLKVPWTNIHMESIIRIHVPANHNWHVNMVDTN